MMGFVAVIGLIFIIIRSDLLLDYRHLNEDRVEQSLVQNKKDLEDVYAQASFLLLIDDDQPELANTLEDSLENMGKKVETRPISEHFTTLTEFDGIIIATENIHDLPGIQSLITYVQTGGSVFFATRPAPGVGLSALYQQIGMVEMGPFIETTGIELTKPFFASSEEKPFLSDEIRNSSLSVRIGQQASLYAKSEEGIPLLWKTEYGEGKFVFFNGTMLSDPSQNGLFVKGIQLMVPTYIYPIINAKVTALEGFPFPIPKGQHKESNMTNDHYVRHVIWADLQRLEAKYDLNYTASFVASFDDTYEPLQANEMSSLQENAIIYGRELLRMGGEFGVQGYNGLSISDRSKAEVQPLMQTTADLMESSLPGYLVKSYIPIDHQAPLTHLNIIKEIFPNVQTALASVDKPFIQDHIAVLPKHFNESHVDSFSEWKALNGLLTSGFISQSIHPQSFLYEEEWEGELQEMTSFQKQLSKDVPWLRNMTLANTAKGVQNYVETVVYEEHTEEGITFHLNQIQAPAYFYFSSVQPVTSFENCEVKLIGPDLYLIETNQLTFTIRLDE